MAAKIRSSRAPGKFHHARTRFAQATVRRLDHLAGHIGVGDDSPVHQQTGRRGEEGTYFYLRRLGYVMVARNSRSSRRGEIDLIGWDQDVLCLIEVKTRTSRRVQPGELRSTSISSGNSGSWRANTLGTWHRMCRGVSIWSMFTTKIRVLCPVWNCSKMPWSWRKIANSTVRIERI
jgi:hypothetical protein